MHLIGTDGRTVQQNTPFEVIKNGPYYESNVVQKIKGRWYYEITHISGPNMHLAGFKFNSYSYFVIYPSAKIPDSSVVYGGCQAPINAYTSLGFMSIKDNSTIGIGFDAFTNKIDFRVDKEQKAYYLTFSEEISIYNTYIYHAIEGDPDYLSINFGEKPFVYSIPPGYTTFNQGPLICYSKPKQQIFGFNFINLIAVIIVV